MSMFMFSHSYDEGIPTLKEVKDEISNLVGLPEIKSQLKTIVDKIVFAEKQAFLGFRVIPPKPFHLVFLGNSGTGKSKVARILGKLFYLAGMLPAYEVVEMQGLTEEMKDTKGKILLVDVDGEGCNFEDLNKIMYVMDKGETPVIFAGSRRALNHCMLIQKELYNKFSAVLNFSDYSCEELAMMLMEKMSDTSEDSPLHGFKLDSSCSNDVIQKLIVIHTCEKLRSKANGFLVDYIIVQVGSHLKQKIGVGANGKDTTTITLVDLEVAFQKAGQVYKLLLLF